MEYKVYLKKIKHVYLRVVSSSQVHITAPLGTSQKTINGIIDRRESWIKKQRDRLLAQENKYDLNNDHLYLLGEKYKIICSDKAVEYLEVIEQKKEIVCGNWIYEPGNRYEIYKALAKGYLQERITYLAEKYGFNFERLYIRGQTTRWGTCSSKGNISLNWKLIIAPPRVIDFIILHELVHLHHLNHGMGFKKELRNLCPFMDEAQSWLRENSFLLKLYSH